MGGWGRRGKCNKQKSTAIFKMHHEGNKGKVIRVSVFLLVRAKLKNGAEMSRKNRLLNIEPPN